MKLFILYKHFWHTQISNTNKGILEIVRHYLKLVQNAVDAARILQEVEGHNVIFDRTAQN